MDNPADGLTLLAPGRAVTLTGEEHHQHVLAGYLPPGAGSREVVVALGWCRIERGKYAGGRAVEARLGGQRIGELTHRMSQRYAPLVEDVLARGGQPGCVAVLRVEERGIQAELRLPAVDQGRMQVDGPPDAAAGGPPTSAGSWPPASGPTAPTEAPTTAWLPTDAPTTPFPRDTRVHPGPAHPYPEVAAAPHPPGPATRRRRRWPGRAAAGFVGLVVVAGITGGDDEPAPTLPSASARSASAAPARPATTVPPAPNAAAAPPATAVATTPPATTRRTAEAAPATSRQAAPPPTRSTPRSTTRTTTRPAPEPEPEPEPKPASAYYPNCTAAKAAGVAPLYAGEPGYSTKLDRDRDGVACE